MDEQSKISSADKALVRENILVFVVQVLPLLRVQLGECLKTIIHVDYPEQWPGLLHWVKHNLQDQQLNEFLESLEVLLAKKRVEEALAALDEVETVVEDANDRGSLKTTMLIALQNAITASRLKLAINWWKQLASLPPKVLKEEQL
uniref:Uncharacterized protein n=1 Tax=Chenopodium quinoa TaxID=63459 RepID=A0A803NAB9_CHEQI